MKRLSCAGMMRGMSADPQNVFTGWIHRTPALLFLRCHLHQLSLAYIVITAVGVSALGWPWWVLVVPGAMLVALVTDGMARPASSLFYPTFSRGPRDCRFVALTFDDGPDPEITPQVLDVLAEAGARATFFVIGKSLTAQPQLAHRMLAEGHVLGNHSWRHSRWQNFFSVRWHARELEFGEQAIADVGGSARPLYRPPVGLKSGELARAAWQRKVTLVTWSLHGHDTFAHHAERIAGRVLGKVRGGDIVLLHDGHDRPGRHRHLCAPALQLILPGLRAKGLECVTVPELLNLPECRPGHGSRFSA